MIKFTMTEAAARVALAGGDAEAVRAAGEAFQTECEVGGFCPELGDTKVDPTEVPLSEVERAMVILEQLRGYPKTFRMAFPALADEVLGATAA